ncbi:hypothetical protein RvY_10282 [Ramazzottius varieornatus]|uniref:IGFBP N-terminal domain-containing protein n=1 Tax=Ramazzottius varieornatus TaxID=947166 RepID=A0A1D1VGR9_RAMVA|nr:hypothetical protein RvY_10282 [Ramazzottius varieornatus]
MEPSRNCVMSVNFLHFILISVLVSEVSLYQHSGETNSPHVRTHYKHHSIRELQGVKVKCICENVRCQKIKKDQCKGGVALDICGCCHICAKVENEKCGGFDNLHGTCDKGLVCNEAGNTNSISTGGRCVNEEEPIYKGIAYESLTLADEALKETTKDVCQPKCTPDFCLKNRTAICSALDNADEAKTCQEKCQHTSCSACRFVNHSPEQCPKCGKDDFPCMKRYGRCIRKKTCQKRKFPCSTSLKRLPKDEGGKYQCLIPDCPDHFASL